MTKKTQIKKLSCPKKLMRNAPTYAICEIGLVECFAMSRITVSVYSSLDGNDGPILTQALPSRKIGSSKNVVIELLIPLLNQPSGVWDLSFVLYVDGVEKDRRNVQITLDEQFAHRRDLIDHKVMEEDFNNLIFADSHAAFNRYPGAGILYYALGVLVRSQVSVCIGSGGGFVPSLMRRAQLDMQITPSTTILIDANLPDLAFGSPQQIGGWMGGGNAFLSREHDIEVLNMLSTDAAELISANGLKIDHLHIDGDHSRRGVVTDWNDFAPLLSEFAVVSLHDTRMPGVAAALNDIRKARPDLQLLNFPEIGAGSAVLRFSHSPDILRRSQADKSFVDAKRRINIASRKVIASETARSQKKSTFERWHYLTSDVFRARYRIALDWVDQSDARLIEIGGFPNSIATLLTKCTDFHAIEPYAPDDFKAAVRKMAGDNDVSVTFHQAGLETLDFVPEAAGNAYNLVFLGLDISSAAQEPEMLYRAFLRLLQMIKGAGRVAIEVPKYATSLMCFEALCEILKPVLIMDITLDLSRDPGALDFHVVDDRAIRRLILFSGRMDVDLSDPLVSARMKRFTADVMEHTAQSKLTGTDYPVYSLGERVGFEKGGAGDKNVVAGFCPPEKAFRWMTGETSRLVFGLDIQDSQLRDHGGLVVEMDLKPFVAPPALPSQQISVAVKGTIIYQADVGERQTLRAHIPPHLLFSHRLLEILVDHPDCARPIDFFDASKDRKQLSFALHSIRISFADEEGS